MKNHSEDSSIFSCVSLYSITIFLFTLFIMTDSFNLETRLPVIKIGLRNSYFGYSVAQHAMLNPSGSHIQEAVFLVGAPIAQGIQLGTNHSGVVYKCKLNTIHRDCTRLSIDDDADREPSKKVSKDGQWLGVTLKSQGVGGYVMTCAHRYVLKGKDYRWGQGICYSLDQYLNYKRAWEPCYNRPVRLAHEQFGYCQAGTSGDISEDQEIVIGTPGTYTWRGTLFTNSITFKMKDDKTWYMGPFLEHKAPVDKYSYLGMSTITGRFFGTKMSYVGGAPRSKGFGQVVFFSKVKGNSTLFIDAILNGEQFASSFGYSMVAIDINNDKHLDLVVSAPFYYNRSAGGAVYIYLNQVKETHNSFDQTPSLKLTGKMESRFGFALANLGDVNKDGYDDLAIGAPYEEEGMGDQHRGVVYIYFGSKEGLRSDPMQIIRASDVRGIPFPYKLHTFGYSLSGGMDMDGNGYPDLLVGAYESDTAILLRARPILNIITFVEGEFHNIDPNGHGCKDEPFTKSLCFSFNACFKLPDIASTNGAPVTVQYRIEAETYTGKKYYRAIFNSSHNEDNPNIVEKEIDLRGGSVSRENCKKELVYIKDPSDIQNPIKFKLTYSLKQRDPKFPKEGDRFPDINRYPILNQEEAHKEFEARFHKNCGANDICEADLRLEAKLHLPYEGSEQILELGQEHVNITMLIENRNEPAYDSYAYINHPLSLSYVGRDIISGNTIECVPQNSTVLRCDLGDPFTKGETKINLRFSPKEILDEEKEIDINIEVVTSSKDISKKRPIVKMQARIVRIAELELRGDSEPLQVFYGGEVKGESAMEYEDDIGSAVVHSYAVTNRGPWRAKRIEVVIDWPYEVRTNSHHGKWLLYMMEIPQVQGIGYCEPLNEDSINPLGIKVRPEFNFNQTHKLENEYEKISSRKYRRKRDTTVPYEEIREDGKKQKIVIMDCRRKTARCFRFSCYILNLYADQTAKIRIRARLWNSTFIEDYAHGINQVHILSHAKIRLDPALDIKQYKDYNDFAAAKTRAYPDLALLPPQEVSLWIIILSVILGIILLVILILILWKIGFFKRKKPGYEPAETEDKEVYQYT